AAPLALVLQPNKQIFEIGALEQPKCCPTIQKSNQRIERFGPPRFPNRSKPPHCRDIRHVSAPPPSPGDRDHGSFLAAGNALDLARPLLERAALLDVELMALIEADDAGARAADV